jgi:hypothetical protein
MQQIKIAFSPLSRGKARRSDSNKEQDEDREGNPVDVLHGILR